MIVECRVRFRWESGVVVFFWFRFRWLVFFGEVRRGKLVCVFYI